MLSTTFRAPAFAALLILTLAYPIDSARVPNRHGLGRRSPDAVPTTTTTPQTDNLVNTPCSPDKDVWACRGTSFLQCTFATRTWVFENSCDGDCVDDPSVGPLCYINSNGTVPVGGVVAPTSTVTATGGMAVETGVGI
ncbi:hypothetical protein HKX48_005038 [Thoreauomyces humboldtii]|nr:hypothetical protein HKX48_005038 [Thoreauomyces humboldtii]